MNGFIIDSKIIQLSSNPLDDFQRLYFLNAFGDLSKISNNDNLSININKIEFKTRYADVFNDIEKFMNLNKNKNNNSQLQSTSQVPEPLSTENKRNRTYMKCWEFQVPNVIINTKESENVVYDISEENWSKLGLDEHNITQFLKGSISTDNEKLISLHDSGNYKFLNENFSMSTLRRKSKQNLTTPLTSKVENFTNIADDVETITLNPNNSIIWTKKDNHVFFSGIWKLYQDVIKALVYTPRYTPKHFTEDDQISKYNENLQNTCKSEFFLTMAAAFSNNDIPSEREPPKLGSTTKRRRRVSIGTAFKHFSTDPNSKYVDFPWSFIDPAFEFQLLINYKNYLRENNIIPTEEIEKIQFKDLLRKVRGGYTKIQGCWLPYQLTRELCLRFCYPIRYFLVPLFGESFAEECSIIFMTMKSNAAREVQMLNDCDNSAFSRKFTSSSSSVKIPKKVRKVVPTTKKRKNKKNERASGITIEDQKEQIISEKKRSFLLDDMVVNKNTNGDETINGDTRKENSSGVSKKRRKTIKNQKRLKIKTEDVEISQIRQDEFNSADNHAFNISQNGTLSTQMKDMFTYLTPTHLTDPNIRSRHSLDPVVDKVVKNEYTVQPQPHVNIPNRESVLRSLDSQQGSLSWDYSATAFLNIDKSSDEVLPPLSSILQIPSPLESNIHRKISSDAANSTYLLKAGPVFPKLNHPKTNYYLYQSLPSEHAQLNQDRNKNFYDLSNQSPKQNPPFTEMNYSNVILKKSYISNPFPLI